MEQHERTAVIDRIFTLFREKGSGAYFGEAVSETEHALQCANRAIDSGANAELVAAALLHDIGHLLHGLPEDIAEHGLDGRHEEAGSAWLARYFGSAVMDPVRLHVAAKRFLCSVEEGYYDGLSEVSQRSLELQGGLMSEDEIRRFQEEPWFNSAVSVRYWDDGAKVPNLEVPGLEHYRTILEDAISKRGQQ
ncbi:MAG: HD domain-containing protein [Planctomycetes bacterium]|nr:HD domain-containing protein [Planctomycetota bacterium]